MDVELLEIRDHLAQHPPFADLPEAVVDEVTRQVEIAYFKAGDEILTFGQRIEELLYIRSGAVEVYRRNGELYNRLSEGEIFGHFGLLRDRSVRFPAKALEDTLIYYIPGDLFDRLCHDHETFADFVEVEQQVRLKLAVEQQGQANDLMSTKVRTLVHRSPVVVDVGATIADVARRMTEEEVSSAIVLEPRGGTPELPDEEGIAILTDRDLRTRVLAQNLSPETQVGEILSRDAITVDSNDPISEAMLTMLRYNIHHLPVLHRGKPYGVVALSDIVRYESQSSLYLVSSIFRQKDVTGLKVLSRELPGTFVKMVENDANSQMVGSAMSSIGRSFTQRLLELGEDKLGPPPVPYCFLSAGSMARGEQLVVTDQDNAMILDDRFQPQEHDAYFEALAKFVSDGLAECGYSYCTGNIMATNTQWRQPLQVWKDYFNAWIDDPTPERLLHSSIFFDLEGVYGQIDLAETLKALLAKRAPDNAFFLGCLGRNTLNRTPPLGFFRTFVMEESGEHKNSINLKRRGTAPLVDLIRVHALATGSRAQNSFERLDDIAKTRLLPDGTTDRLGYALEFISAVRIRHQAEDIRQGRRPDNNVEPEHLSVDERRNLKDAFQVLSNAQKFVRYRYPMSPRQRRS
ncbi:putative nucleotidyltransferase substrate binding domain-containing protein [Marinobacteraceae bacterium S3BR75-40.1]